MTALTMLKEVPTPQPQDALDFILFEHKKHREMCDALDALAEAPDFNPAEVAKLADFIRTELTMHIIDEEEELFPLLRLRCEPEDEVEAALDRFDGEHESDRDLSARVRIFLYSAITEDKPLSCLPGARAALHEFAQNQRLHMMLENAVLIPLARRRLTAGDLEALGKRFAARRRRGATSST